MQRRLQLVVNQTMEVIKTEIGIIDEHGKILASSVSSRIGQPCISFPQIEKSEESFIYHNGYLYSKLNIIGKIDIITYIVSDDTEENRKLLSLFSITALSMKKVYDEKHDKLNFFKNILLDNILPGDIPIKARELCIQNNVTRLVYLVKCEKNVDVSLYDMVCPLFRKKDKEFVVSIDEETCVVIKEVDKLGNIDTQNKIIIETANIILDNIKKDSGIKVAVGIGFPARRIKEIGSSYKEAQMALLVGGIFNEDKSIVNYTSLGVGRLIYQLPKTLCELFLQEIFRDKMNDILDNETVMTFEKLCECSFNLSETARALFLHRNTLIYRIEKVREATNLDLRVFEDAVVFKVAMLVKKYIEKAEKSVY